MATELQVERNSFLRLFERFSRESVILIVAVICAFFAVDSFFRSGRAVDISNAANAKVDYELEATRAELTAAKNLMALQNVYLQELYFLLKTEGLDPPPLPEE